MSGGWRDTSEGERGRKGRERRVKYCCGRYLEALGEECVHVIKTASRA